jgi:hypothetical protein
VPAGEQVEVDEDEEIVGRVAAIDVAKASAMVCTRMPHATKTSQRVTTVWQVPSTTNQVLELAEQLAGQGIQRVVVESTSDYWRPFRLPAGRPRTGGVAGQRPRRPSTCRAGPRPTRWMRCGWPS